MEFLCGLNDKSSFSYFLKGALQARKSTIIDSDAFLGAVYVDLRYNRLLPPEHKERGKNHIFYMEKTCPSV